MYIKAINGNLHKKNVIYCFYGVFEQKNNKLVHFLFTMKAICTKVYF